MNRRLQSIFVYEHVSAGGLGSEAPPSLVREGRAMLLALLYDLGAALDDNCTTIVHDRVSIPTLPKAVRVSSQAQRDQAFDRLVSTADASVLIAPETDGVLSSLSKRVLALGGRLLSPSPECVAIYSDKLRTAEHLSRAGIRCVPTRLANPDETHTHAVVVKPRDGAGSECTELAPKNAKLRCDGDAIVTTYVEGIPASVLMICGPRDFVLFPPTRQLVAAESSFAYEGGERILDPSLARRAHGLARDVARMTPRLQGYVGVDIILATSPSDDVVIEVNPRLCTSYLGLRHFVPPTQLAEMWFEAVLGDEVRSPEWETSPLRFGVELEPLPPWSSAAR
ncbi:MAG: ATP-grasp domain-containing protein [Planctomycetota bacterium]